MFSPCTSRRSEFDNKFLKGPKFNIIPNSLWSSEPTSEIWKTARDLDRSPFHFTRSTNWGASSLMAGFGITCSFRVTVAMYAARCPFLQSPKTKFSNSEGDVIFSCTAHWRIASSPFITLTGFVDNRTISRPRPDYKDGKDFKRLDWN